MYIFIYIFIEIYIHKSFLRHALVRLWMLFALESSQRTQHSGSQFAGDTELGGRADPPQGSAAARATGTVGEMG